MQFKFDEIGVIVSKEKSFEKRKDDPRLTMVDRGQVFLSEII